MIQSIDGAKIERINLPHRLEMNMFNPLSRKTRCREAVLEWVATEASSNFLPRSLSTSQRKTNRNRPLPNVMDALLLRARLQSNLLSRVSCISPLINCRQLINFNLLLKFQKFWSDHRLPNGIPNDLYLSNQFKLYIKISTCKQHVIINAFVSDCSFRGG